jgi:hypothetical protein
MNGSNEFIALMMFCLLSPNIPEFDDAVPEDLIYSGQVKLTDAVSNLQMQATVAPCTE